MKIKINTKFFTSNLKRLKTKGKLTLNGKDEPHINMALVSAHDGVLFLFGVDKNRVIYVNAEFPCEVIEEGDDLLISDLNEFTDVISDVKDKFVEVEFTETTIKVVSDSREVQYGVEVSKVPPQLLKWIESNKYEDEKVIISSNGKTAEFTKWFEIKGETLNEVQSNAIKFARTHTVHFMCLDSELAITSENKHTNKVHTAYYKAEIVNPADYNIVNMFPVLNSLKDRAIFFYYVSSTGSLRVWVHNVFFNWMVTIPKVINGEGGEETED